MRDPIELKPADVKPIINATFPDYRRKKVWLYASETVTLHDLNWSGGTRMQYRACSIDGRFVGAADNTTPLRRGRTKLKARRSQFHRAMWLSAAGISEANHRC
jgi:hypothetical protein